ncbi:MAG TPA: hypothetical protein VE397_04820 [Stellaceae bacterium]|nr:hypothetical protein [Stellaceae bacterium]
MLNPTEVLAEALGQHLADGYRKTFGEGEPEAAVGLYEAAHLIIERIGSSDALYHDAQHTMMVALVAQDILRGKRLEEPVSAADWYHFIIAALAHDIGYVRGICAGDTAKRFVIDDDGNSVVPPRGASDAFLTPYHVDRSKIAVRERFRSTPQVDAERIARAIEMTRFPIPDGATHAETNTEAGLLRAADLIGQLADPLYPSKLTALYYEFMEIGYLTQLGYHNPADLIQRYPNFFWNTVEPYLHPALRYLDHTIEGKQWIANLYSHVLTAEHDRMAAGPQPGAKSQE